MISVTSGYVVNPMYDESMNLIWRLWELEKVSDSLPMRIANRLAFCGLKC